MTEVEKKESVLTPQQETFLAGYLDVKSETFGNALQSALRAGYSQEYAESLTSLMPKWLSENIGDAKRVKKAETNLDNMLDMDVEELIIGMFGPVVNKETGEIYKKDNINKIKIKADITKFTLEKLNRKKYGQDKANVVVPVQINFSDAREEFE